VVETEIVTSLDKGLGLFDGEVFVVCRCESIVELSKGHWFESSVSKQTYSRLPLVEDGVNNTQHLAS